MILPRYSIRTLLLITILFAVLSLVARQAMLAKPWAIGLTVATGAAGVLILSHMLLFALANVFVAVRHAFRRPEAGRSPFASAGLPRQVVAPVDPE